MQSNRDSLEAWDRDQVSSPRLRGEDQGEGQRRARL